MKGFTLLCEASVKKLYGDHAGHRKALTGPSDRGQSVAGIVSHAGLAVLRFVPKKAGTGSPLLLRASIVRLQPNRCHDFNTGFPVSGCLEPHLVFVNI